MDGAWAFWQHCCRSRWQLPTQATRESIMGRQRGTERDVVRERERDGVDPPCWKFFFFFFPGNASLSWGTPTAPVLLPSVRLALSLSTVCDAFRAPRLVIRVIYAALIAPRWTITALDCQGRHCPILSSRDSGLLFYRWGSTSGLDPRTIDFSSRSIVADESFDEGKKDGELWRICR